MLDSIRQKRGRWFGRGKGHLGGDEFVPALDLQIVITGEAFQFLVGGRLGEANIDEPGGIEGIAFFVDEGRVGFNIRAEGLLQAFPGGFGILTGISGGGQDPEGFIRPLQSFQVPEIFGVLPEILRQAGLSGPDDEFIATGDLISCHELFTKA